jgi:Ras-related protein Rab-1A
MNTQSSYIRSEQNSSFLSNNNFTFTIITIGNSSVGKTSIINRLVNKSFNETVKPTIGVSDYLYTVSVDDKTANLKFFDTCGHEKYRSLTKQYFQIANGILVVFDLTDKKSFNALKDWFNDIENNCDPDKVKEIIVLGNKLDDHENRKVREKAVREMLTYYNCTHYYETSAKTGKGIESAIKTLAWKLIEKSENINDFSKSNEQRKRRHSIDSQGINTKKNKCC